MIRVHGDLRKINLPSLSDEQLHSILYDIINDGQRKTFEEVLECDFSFEIPNLARFRVNAFNQNRRAAAVFRTIPFVVLTLDELKAPKIFQEIAETPRGLVLVTWPKGSDKSTALAAMVDCVNENKFGHILTVEDPDVILVGEMRIIEMIRLALSAAETGHLVFGKLHTSSAAKTIDRVVDMIPVAEKEMVSAMLSESLRAVISQALCKTKGGEGRIAAYKIMIATPAIRHLIRENKVAQMYLAIQTG